MFLFLLETTNCRKIVYHFNSMSALGNIIWIFEAMWVKKKKLLITHFENWALSMGADVHRDFDTLGCVSGLFLCRYLKIISDAPKMQINLCRHYIKPPDSFLSNFELLCENVFSSLNWIRKHENYGTYGQIDMTDISQGAPAPVNRFPALTASCISMWAISLFGRT